MAQIPYTVEDGYTKEDDRFPLYNIPWAIPCSYPSTIGYRRQASLNEMVRVEFSSRIPSFMIPLQQNRNQFAKPVAGFYWAVASGEPTIETTYVFSLIMLWENTHASYRRTVAAYPEMLMQPAFTPRSLEQLARDLLLTRNERAEIVRAKGFRGLFAAIKEIMPCHAAEILRAEDALAIKLRQERLYSYRRS